MGCMYILHTQAKIFIHVCTCYYLNEMLAISSSQASLMHAFDELVSQKTERESEREGEREIGEYNYIYIYIIILCHL